MSFLKEFTNCQTHVLLKIHLSHPSYVFQARESSLPGNSCCNINQILTLLKLNFLTHLESLQQCDELNYLPPFAPYLAHVCLMSSLTFIPPRNRFGNFAEELRRKSLKKSIGNSPPVQNNGCWDTMSIVRSYPGNFLFSHVILSLWSFEASKRRDPHYLTDMKIKFELTSSLIICIACGGPSNEKCFDKTQVFVICPYTLHQQIQTSDKSNSLSKL